MIKKCYSTLFIVLLGAMWLPAQDVHQTPWHFSNFGVHAEGSVNRSGAGVVIITRHTRHAFFDQDFYSFNYQHRAFPYGDCSQMDLSVRIDSVKAGSAGIMIRSDTAQDAANVHLETSALGDILLYSRKGKGAPTSYTRLGKLEFPMELRLVRMGDVFTGYCRQQGEKWQKGAAVMAAGGAEPLIGTYACSGKEFPADDPHATTVTAKAVFSNWEAKYTETYYPPGPGDVDHEPLKKGTLMRENFDDGAVSNKPASVINPTWPGTTYAVLPPDPKGGRYWHKTGDGFYLLGNKKWTDYEVGLDVAFAKNSPSSTELTVMVRYQDISVYASLLKYYAVSLQGGDRLLFKKVAAGQLSLNQIIHLPSYLDGARHRLVIRILDKKYEVLFDGKRILAGEDERGTVSYGNIALKFTDALLDIDNIEVLSIDDPVNGSADNFLQDYFDTPLPAYLEKYGFPTNDKKE